MLYCSFNIRYNLKKLGNPLFYLNIFNMNRSVHHGSSQNKLNLFDFKEKVAVISASTEGIGYEIAKRFGLGGAHVLISSRRKSNVEKAEQSLQKLGCKVSATICHVSKAEDRKHLVNKATDINGGIDFLVCNAAVNPGMGGVLQCSEPMWDKIFEVNVKNALQLTQEAAPKMRKGGSIVYISSIAAYNPFPLLGAYSVSKTALLGLTRAVAQELASDGIRVNCVAPGIIRTKFSEPLYSSDEIMEKAVEPTLLKRIGEPGEVAGLVCFLCSEDAKYITGENLVVSGGMQSRL